LEVVLVRFERERFAAPKLRELQAAMRAEGLTASAQVRELRQLVGWLNSRRNMLFLPVALLRLWGTRFAFRLEAWRRRSGPAVGRWVRAVGEAEALSSLAGHAYENPADVFPVVEGNPSPGPSPERGGENDTVAGSAPPPRLGE